MTANTTATPPPLRKPRNPLNLAPLTEDEIRALKEPAINIAIAMFVQTHESPTDYSTNIGAAFAVDRPNWRWEMEDYDRDHFDVMVVDRDTEKSAIYTQLLDRKATPQDYARARCVAALLLAAKIGE